MKRKFVKKVGKAKTEVEGLLALVTVTGLEYSFEHTCTERTYYSLNFYKLVSHNSSLFLWGISNQGM